MGTRSKLPSGLTLLEEQFIAAYLGPARGNSTVAAEAAGIQRATRDALSREGYRLLRRPRVAQAIQRAVTDKRVLSARATLEGISGIASDPTASCRDRLRAYELLGRYHRLWTTVVEVEDPHHVLASLLGCSLEEVGLRAGSSGKGH